MILLLCRLSFGFTLCNASAGHGSVLLSVWHSTISACNVIQQAIVCDVQ